VATFGLIHGAYHGTWQWGPLVAELERRGQRSVCVNLPIDDPDRGVPDYAASAAQAFEGIDDLVVVGHSLAGRVIPFVAELLPVRGLVFLAGAVQAGVFGPVPSGPSLLIAEADHTKGDDGGHSPFLSRPDELAELLVGVAGDLERLRGP
jgi:pimeloyl-ACP methyl ester carboxylesterase